MANPQEDVAPQTGATGANAMLNGEFYLNERTGRTHVRLPAGGAGGGITSYADVPATEAQHVSFLKSQVELKDAEHKALVDQHAKANEKLEKHQAKAKEEEAKQKKVDDKKVEDEPDVSNPITAETYGRPPMNPRGLDNQSGPHNPADERDNIDHQPVSSSVKEPT